MDEWTIFILIVFLVTLVYVLKPDKVKIISNGRKPFIFIWLALSLSILVSKNLNHDLDTWEIGIILLSMPTFFLYVSPRIRQFVDVIAISAVFSYLPLLILLFHDVNIHVRDNSIGILTSFTGALVLILIQKKINNNSKIVWVLVTGVFFVVLLFLNGSRTGLLSYLVVFLYVYIQSAKRLRIKSLGKVIIFHFSVLAIIICFLLFQHKFLTLILDKWSGYNVDITSGRLDMWIGTIKDASPFGHGSGYFFRLFNIGDGHNIFIQVLGQYGYITLLIFIILFLYLFFKLLKLENDIYKIIFIVYILMGLFENVLILNYRFSTITFILLLFIGNILNKEPKNNG